MSRLTLIVLLALALLTGCSPDARKGSRAPESPGTRQETETPAAPQDPATASLIRSRCTRCHDTQRIEGASHDADGWRSTVERMRSRGAQLSDAEAVRVVDFLAGGGGKQL